MKKVSGLLNRNCLLTAILLTALCFICIRLFEPMRYYNPDDRYVMLAVAGAYNGQYVTVFPFVNVLYCTAVSALYRLLPAVAWYSVAFEGLQFAACCGICYTLLKLFSLKKYPLWTGILAFLAIFFALILPMCTTLNFTPIAALCAVAAVVLLYLAVCTQPEEKVKLPAAVASVLFLFLSFIIRDQCALIGLCFYALTAVYGLFRQHRLSERIDVKALRRRYVTIILTVLVCVAAIGLAAVADKNAKNSEDYRTCNEWNNVRSDFLDFKEVSYEEAPELYESVGWNEEYYKLASSWYFADDKTDIDSLTTIHAYAQQKNETTVFTALGDMLHTAVQLATTPQFVMYFIVLLLLTVAAFFLTLRRKPSPFAKATAIAYILCILFGMALMWLYLSYIGRFVGHVLRVTVMPAIVLLLGLCINSLPENTAIAPQQRKSFFCFAAILVASAGSIWAQNTLDSRLLRLGCLALFTAVVFAAALLPVWKLAGKTFMKKAGLVCLTGLLAGCYGLSMFTAPTGLADTMHARSKAETAIEQYALANEDEIIVTALFIKDKNALTNFPTEKPINLFIAFDYLRYTDAYSYKFEQNGIESLTIASYFDEPNVYYAGFSEDDETLSLLLDYMKTQYGQSVHAVVYKELADGAAVYRLMK